MSGVRPIEMIVQVALSEQAPTGNLYNHFCMAELLQVPRLFLNYLLTFLSWTMIGMCCYIFKDWAYNKRKAA